MALVAKVEQPPGRGDQDVNAGFERLDLVMLADAAEDDGGAQAAAARRRRVKRSAIWLASSRVGARMRACGALGVRWRR